MGRGGLAPAGSAGLRRWMGRADGGDPPPPSGFGERLIRGGLGICQPPPLGAGQFRRGPGKELPRVGCWPAELSPCSTPPRKSGGRMQEHPSAPRHVWVLIQRCSRVTGA